jgi:hypothetical protein
MLAISMPQFPQAPRRGLVSCGICNMASLNAFRAEPDGGCRFLSLSNSLAAASGLQ